VREFNYLPVLLVTVVALGAVNAPRAEDDSAAQQDAWALLQEQPEGYRLGTFLVQPEAALSGVYDSNIFATRSDEIEDGILVFSPGVEVTSDWERHKLDLDLGGAFGRYASHTDEDYDDYWIDADGRYDFSDSSNVFGGLGFSREHEDRGSPEDSAAGDEPTTYQSRRVHAGTSQNRGKAGLRLGGTYEQLDYDDAGPLSNEDRNREMLGAGARLSYELHPQYSLYGQGVWDGRIYDERYDDYGFERDSHGYRAGAGVQATFSNRLRGDAYLGYLRQEYEDPRFSTVNELDFAGSLRFRATARTTLSMELDRSLEETTLPDSSGYLYTSLSSSVHYRLTPRMNVNAGLAVAAADYNDVDRTDEYYSARFGMRYYLTPRWYLGGEYRVYVRNSDVREEIDNAASMQDLEDYGRNQFFLTLGTLLYPVKTGDYWDMPAGERLRFSADQWQGLYGGAQIGHDTLNLHTEGGRDDGTDESEYSNTAGSSGLFAGYGFLFGNWYAGVEGELEDGDADIQHSKAKSSSRTVELERDDSYGVALRGGYRLDSGPLLYGRLGMVRTDFKAYATVNSRTESAYDHDRTETGTRFGLGSDIPVTDTLFLRLDYSYTDYDDFEGSLVDSHDTLQTERFSPREDLFRIGLGWQPAGFGAGRQAQEIDVSGLYAGATIGHGALQSDVSGQHYDSGGLGPGESGPFAFEGDFGDDSAATGGVFVGYGHLLGRYYLGLEGELEDSNAEWDHEREPGGRDFSMEKMDSRGIALRAGYLLQNGSLVYLRAGKVRTRFNTTWTKGNDPLLHIDRDDTLSGTRLGLGTELPLSRSVFARLDYSYTDYDSLDFVSGHNNPDTMEFDNSESLFRAGVGVRF